MDGMGLDGMGWGQKRRVYANHVMPTTSRDPITCMERRMKPHRMVESGDGPKPGQ